jgi:hypothetical protein
LGRGRWRWTALLGALFVGLLVTVAGSGLASTSRHGNPSLYLDLRAGDGGAAPDIFTTLVRNTARGKIVFEVTLTNRDAIGENDFLAVDLNTDRNPATGSSDGVDYLLVAFPGGDVVLGRWSGTQFERVDGVASLEESSFAGGKQTFTVAAADIGNTRSFLFYVYSQLRDNDAVFDSSPDGSTDFWEYSVARPHVEAVNATFSPSRPRAGQRFRVASVRFVLPENEVIPGEGFRCRATLAGKRLAGKGVGGCTFTLPKTAKRKRLVVTLSITEDGRSKSFRPYSFVVR